YRRDAVAALMGSDGQVPTGTVDDRLLEDDSSAPFGVRLDHDAVLRAFDGAWTGRAVVLVEASDLVRADAFLSFASDAAGRQAKMRALHSTDELIGQLLQRVDAGRDAVVVVGPSTSTNQRTLTVAAVRAPGFGPSLLRSPTTQRTGYAQLIDVAPTLLHLLDVDVPTSMRGRVLEAAGPHGSAADRWSSL